MRLPKPIRAVWDFFSALGTIVFVAGFLGLVVATLAAAVADMSDGLRVLLFFGVAGLTASTILLLVQSVPALARFKSAPPPTAPPMNPNARAAALKADYDDRKAEEDAQNAVLALRDAVRTVREELLDNKDRLVRIEQGDLSAMRDLTGNWWHARRHILIAYKEQEPFAAASEAYRRIQIVQNAMYTRSDDNPNLAVEVDDPSAPLDSDVLLAQSAVNEAVKVLTALGDG